MEFLLIGVMIAGFTQFVKSLFDRDYRTAVIIFGAAAIGGVCGFFGFEVQGVPAGIAAGLLASGLVTIAKAAGGQRISNPQ